MQTQNILTKNRKKPLTDKEIELKGWVEALEKDCPEIPRYFIEHLATAYQLNPEKFDNIIENNVKVEPSVIYDEGGVVDSITIYKDLEEFEQKQKELEDLKEKKSN